jgi:hypothetical protein
MRVQIDTAREHELSGRVEISRGLADIADRDNAPVVDTDIRAGRAASGNDGAAADR